MNRRSFLKRFSAVAACVAAPVAVVAKPEPLRFKKMVMNRDWHTFSSMSVINGRIASCDLYPIRREVVPFPPDIKGLLHEVADHIEIR